MIGYALLVLVTVLTVTITADGPTGGSEGLTNDSQIRFGRGTSRVGIGMGAFSGLKASCRLRKRGTA
jgi:hypothetical protein